MMGKELHEMTLEELWELFPVYLVPHHDKWRIYYAEIEEYLWKLLLGHAERISHIGSTAVNGIWAKDIVDVLVEVQEAEDIEKAALLIEGGGFIRMSAGERRISFNRGYTRDGFADKVFHVHLRYFGDNDELYFRDYLNEHPQVAGEYEAIKLCLWHRFEFNRDAYTEGKALFVRKWTSVAKKLYAGRY